MLELIQLMVVEVAMLLQVDQVSGVVVEVVVLVKVVVLHLAVVVVGVVVELVEYLYSVEMVEQMV